MKLTIDRAVFALAGFLVLASLALGFLVSPYWYLLTAFVGLNLFQSAFSGFCPAVHVLRRIGLKQSQGNCR